MPVSHFLFRRGTEQFEVFVAEKWDNSAIDAVTASQRRATKLFLEVDDFTAGSDVFALDFLLMQKTGEHLDGKNLLSEITVDQAELRLGLEGEVRRLAAKARLAYFRKEQIPGQAALNTLQGIATGLEHLGMQEALPAEIGRLCTRDLGAALFPRKRIGPILALLQRWEGFLQS
jgi:hypothetical protein